MRISNQTREKQRGKQRVRLETKEKKQRHKGTITKSRSDERKEKDIKGIRRSSHNCDDQREKRTKNFDRKKKKRSTKNS